MVIFILKNLVIKFILLRKSVFHIFPKPFFVKFVWLVNKQVWQVMKYICNMVYFLQIIFSLNPRPWVPPLYPMRIRSTPNIQKNTIK